MRKIELWSEVVDTLKIDLGKPINFVSAAEVGEIAGRDPRHMSKIDEEKNLPRVFTDAHVFILPVSNETWAIVRGKGYHVPETSEYLQSYSSRMPFLPATLRAGLSEAQRIDYALCSGLVSHIVGEATLWPGFRSRKFSPQFSFRVDGLPPLTASGVQVDFDACYESQKSMVHIEAKTGKVPPSSFNIRQLYYPYRCLREWVPEKATREFLFFYNSREDSYNFWEYHFTDHENYESIELVNTHSFRILLPERPERLDEQHIPTSPRASIPNQADSISKIEAFPFYVSEGYSDRDSLAEVFGFRPRQSDYYGLAAESLGLVELKDARYGLTDLGMRFVKMNDAEREESLCRRILTVPLMHRVAWMVKSGETVTFPELQQMVQEELDRHSRRAKRERSHSMGKRRAQTAVAWFRWLEKATGEFTVTKNCSICQGYKRL